MIKSYIQIALRNLIRSKGHSFINIVGLAVGMGVTMLIGMWVYDEISFNKAHQNYDRIAEIYQHQIVNNEISTAPYGPIPLVQELRTTYKEDIKHVVMGFWEFDHILSEGDQSVLVNGNFMEPEVLEMFSFKMLKGSWQSLKDRGSIVISESTAKAIFGDADPINKILQIDDSKDVKVTGVYAAFPANSRFHSLQFVSTWAIWNWMNANEHTWENSGELFVEIQPHTTFEAVSAKIESAKLNKINKEQAQNEDPRLFLHPMKNWHLYSEWKAGNEAGGRIQFVWLFSIIGAFVLLLACINFMNLSTAQSSKRAKEVGIRKSIGSLRLQLVYQFLSESFLVVVFAFVLAMAFVTMSLPWFNELANKRMDLLWTNPYFWSISFAFIFITAMLAGSYPALYLSSFQPVKVLKGTFNVGKYSAIPRKVLIVLQFTVSVTLIIGTIIVWQQIQYAKDRPIGYDRQGLIMIRKISGEVWGKFRVLRNELKEADAIVEMAESTGPATAVWGSSNTLAWKGKDPNRHDDFVTLGITYGYGKTMGWTFIEGRDYSREMATDSTAIVLNETAVRLMGLQEPVNEEITWHNKKYTVIGVIKDMIMESPYEQVKQTVFWMDTDGKPWINMRLNPILSSTEALSRVEKVFQKVLPGVPFDYKFIDDEYALKFASEERVGKLASVFSGLAIFISCLGLLGMASYMAEQRQKEIALRKILGASVANLWRMLSSEFILLVSIACATGIPIVWYFLDQWLKNFEYHTQISIWIFIATSIGALAMTILTVSYQTLKVSISNPVKSLRAD